MTTIENPLQVNELRLLEAEAVHIIREVVAELQRPVLLFSAGKDSIVLLRLAEGLSAHTVALPGATRRHRT